MRILMFGIGHGHNVKRFFDHFQDSDEHELTYFYTSRPGHYDLSKYDRIRWIPFYRPFKLLKALRSRSDLLWVHNWTPIPVLLFILLFRRKDVPINYNVWSEPVPREARSNTWKGAFYRFFFRRCRTVQCTWYGTYELLEPLRGVNPVLLRWGMEEVWFREGDPEALQKETKDFLDSLPEDRTRFFFPKSLSKGNRHDLIIDATEILVQRGRTNFIVYFWMGNESPDQLLRGYRERIRSAELEEWVRIVEHSFLPSHDIKLIWEAMDVGLQILEMDQFSTSIQEPMLLKKELIASDLPPYRKFEEKFGLDLGLIPNEKERIAERMERIIDGERSSEDELERRKEVLWNEYRFDRNIEKMLSYFDEATGS